MSEKQSKKPKQEAKAENNGEEQKMQDELKAIKEELENIKKEKEELNDKLLRMAADYDNYRKRSCKEKDDIYTNATADIIENLLPAIDSLELAKNKTKESDKKEDVAKGLDLIHKQLKDILMKLEVEEISCLGESFDPQLHEAVMHVQDEQFGDNEVVEELKKGYMYKDKVIRHSIVKVAN